jgi:hypothetical protein
VYSVIRAIFITLLLTLAACSAGPGALEGKWKQDGDMALTIEFRAGESESMGLIEKVEYEARGEDVLVRYVDGIAKGTAMRFTIVDDGTIRSELGTFHKVD